MTRASVIQEIEQYFDQDQFFSDLSRRVSIPTESQVPERAADLHRYQEAVYYTHLTLPTTPYV